MEAEKRLPRARPPGVADEEQDDEGELGGAKGPRERRGRGHRDDHDPEDEDGGGQERPPGQDDEVDPEGGRPEPEPLARDGARRDAPPVRSGGVRALPGPVANELLRLRSAGLAERHLHLEGAIRPATAVALAARWPSSLFPDGAAFRARRRFEDFRGFLTLYRDVCRLLRSPADYARVARDLTGRLRRERIVDAEVYVSPAVVERIGLDWVDVRDALEAVFAAHERRGGGRLAVLLDSVRQWGPEAAHRVLDLHERHPWSRAVGFGLGGDEAAVPASAFREVYRRLPRLGLAPLVHAGEWAGPESVAQALDALRPVRIAHGIRAAEDPALVRRLARLGTFLDVCLASNAATGAVADPSRHPVRRLLAAGVRVTLSTDDPGLFGTTLLGEYRRLARLGAGVGELRAVAAHARAAALVGGPSRHGSAGGSGRAARTRS